MRVRQCIHICQKPISFSPLSLLGAGLVYTEGRNLPLLEELVWDFSRQCPSPLSGEREEETTLWLAKRASERFEHQSGRHPSMSAKSL